MHLEVAHIDAVQRQQRQARREGAGRLAVGFDKHFPQPAVGEIGALAPVIEITGDNHRRVGGNLGDPLRDQAQLLLAMDFPQPQVHADGMHVLHVARQAQHAMQQPATFVAALGDVEIVVADDLEFRQQRITVVAMGIHRVATVGVLRPDTVGEELVLRHARPVAVALGVALVGAVDFLKEHHVGGHTANRLPQLGQYEAPVERGEALVGIDRQHPEAGDGFGGRGWHQFRMGHDSTPVSGNLPGSVASAWSRPKRCSNWRASKGARTLMSLSK